MPIAHKPQRPVVGQKKSYVPHSPPEEFIVPLLMREIEYCVAEYATPTLGRAKAIDIGCGGQPFRGLLEDVGYSYCAVDVNSAEAKMDFVCAVDEALPEGLLELGPFDFLLCTEVLEHVADWRMAFANLALLLALGGRALITTPYFFHLHEEPFDFWRPTLHAIEFYGRGVGLEPIYQNAAGDGWGVLGTALGSCRFLPRSRRLIDRVIAKGMRGAGKIAFRTLLSKSLRERVITEGGLYLSNVVVLEKAGAARRQ